jgi:hypothetical protein
MGPPVAAKCAEADQIWLLQPSSAKINVCAMQQKYTQRDAEGEK